MPSTQDDAMSLLERSAKPVCLAAILCACLAAFSNRTEASSISFSLVYSGPAEVASHTVVSLEVRASFDTPLVATTFSLSASGDAEASIVARSASPLAANGLSYLSATSQEPFESNLPHDLTAQSLREALLDLDYNDDAGGTTDGVSPGTDILIETIDVEISGTGEVAITLGNVDAANTADDANGSSFESVTINPAAETVLIGIEGTPLGDLNCDGAVNDADIAPFVTALLDAAAFEAQYPSCDRLNADMDENESLDGRDIDDFVERLLP